MNEKTKKIVLIFIGCIIRLGILAAIIIFKYYTITSAVLLGIFGFFGVLMWFGATIVYLLICNIIMLFVPAPPVPDIQQQSFPYEIVYSIDEEVFNKTDILEYKYKAYSDVEQLEKNWRWESSSGTGTFNLLCEIEDEKIYIDCGNAQYYMTGEKPYDEYTPGEYVYYYDDDDEKIKLTHKEAKEKFGIEIISKKFSEPIENEFKYKTVDKIRLFLFGKED